LSIHFLLIIWISCLSSFYSEKTIDPARTIFEYLR